MADDMVKQVLGGFFGQGAEKIPRLFVARDKEEQFVACIPNIHVKAYMLQNPTHTIRTYPLYGEKLKNEATCCMVYEEVSGAIIPHAFGVNHPDPATMVEELRMVLVKVWQPE